MRHARISASGAHRWMNCPGSIDASLPYIRPSSQPAMLGTAAHLLASTCLRTGNSPSAYLYQTICVSLVPGVEEFFLAPNAVSGENSVPFEVDRSMVQAVTQFVDEVNAATQEFGCTRLHVEEFLDLTWIHPDLGGTADAYFLGRDNWIHLYDYKHGQSISVEVEDSDQLRVYSVGTLYKYPNAEGVRMSIVQPRKSHADGFVRSVVYTREELKPFVRALRKVCKKIDSPNPPLASGEWCDFCPFGPHCPVFGR
jgi:hypothetical protein